MAPYYNSGSVTRYRGGERGGAPAVETKSKSYYLPQNGGIGPYFIAISSDVNSVKLSIADSLDGNPLVTLDFGNSAVTIFDRRDKAIAVAEADFFQLRTQMDGEAKSREQRSYQFDLLHGAISGARCAPGLSEALNSPESGIRATAEQIIRLLENVVRLLEQHKEFARITKAGRRGKR